MGIIKASKLIYEYIRRDEDEQVEEINRAINNLDLDIHEGDFVAILGHNGSGKSTFAKQINGILLPTEGTVWISGMNTSDDSHIWDIRKTAGMVFQNPDNQIIGNIVEEDVGFGPENMGVPTDEIWRRVDASLEAVGMTAYRMKSPNKLSGGQKQRVAIAGVMAMRPKCIILDEPTSHLDIKYKLEFLTILQKMRRKKGLTVIMSLHELELAERISDKVLCVNGVHAERFGSPYEVFKLDYIMQLFGIFAEDSEWDRDVSETQFAYTTSSGISCSEQIIEKVTAQWQK